MPGLKHTFISKQHTPSLNDFLLGGSCGIGSLLPDSDEEKKRYLVVVRRLDEA